MPSATVTTRLYPSPRMTGLEMPLPVVSWARPGRRAMASMMLVDEVVCRSRRVRMATGVGESLSNWLPAMPVTTTSLIIALLSRMLKSRC